MKDAKMKLFQIFQIPFHSILIFVLFHFIPTTTHIEPLLHHLLFPSYSKKCFLSSLLFSNRYIVVNNTIFDFFEDLKQSNGGKTK